MRRAILVAVLALAACDPRAPAGSTAFPLAETDRDFRLDARERRVMFVRGFYPEKTYVGSIDLASGHVRVHRSAGRMIVGSPTRRASSARTLFLAAPIVDTYAGEVEIGGIVLEASPGRPSSDRALQLEDGRRGICIAETAWSAGALIITARDGREARLGRWREGSAAFEGLATLPAGIVDCSASAHSPRLGMIIAGKKPRFAVWKVDLSREASSVPLPLELTVIGRAEDGRFFAAWDRANSGDRVLASLDPETGGFNELFASSASIVSAAAMPSGTVVLVRNDRASSGIAGHLKPQRIVKIGTDGRVEWAMDWSRLPSRLVGFDEATGRLLVAVVDTAYASLWAIPTEQTGFDAAVHQIERAANPVRRRIGMGLKALLPGAIVLALIIGLLSAAR